MTQDSSRYKTQKQQLAFPHFDRARFLKACGVEEAK